MKKNKWSIVLSSAVYLMVIAECLFPNDSFYRIIFFTILASLLGFFSWYLRQDKKGMLTYLTCVGIILALAGYEYHATGEVTFFTSLAILIAADLFRINGMFKKEAENSVSEAKKEE